MNTAFHFAAVTPMRFEFAHPWLLVLLALVPLLALLKGRQGRRAAFVYSSVALVKPLHGAARSSAGRLLLSLRWLALALGIVALARPQFTQTETSVSESGVDIVVALDLSGSMRAVDFELNGREANRLELAKDVLKKFVARRPSDRIGVVAFAGRAYVAAPITLDHDFLTQNIERLDFGTVREEGTAVGSALAAALNRLRELKSKSKIVILMTDGQSNAGKVPPLTAAEAAQALGVKCHTIGVGKRGGSFVYQNTPWGRQKQPMQADLDEEQLTQIAERTGGKYFRADDTARFRAIYDEIDKLEKTEVNVKKFTRHHELAHWLILGALTVLLLEILLANTALRRLP